MSGPFLFNFHQLVDISRITEFNYLADFFIAITKNRIGFVVQCLCSIVYTNVLPVFQVTFFMDVFRTF